jgi:peptidoglycan-associated lipoprotein
MGSAGVESPTGASHPTTLAGVPLPEEFDEAAALQDVYFEFDQATARAEDARVFDRNARWLAAHPGALVLIEGHADERGTNEYNLALGESRAKAARDQLVARGIARSRMTTLSYGEERPACREAAERCWARNRRAHFLVKSAVAAHTPPR